MFIIPAIDVIQGQCVRLRQGDFEQQSIYDISPVALAEHYAAQGAKRLHIVDLDGAKAGSPQHLELIQRLQSCDLMIQAGGGIRSVRDAEAFLSAGVARIVIGSIAISNPALTQEIIDKMGAEQVILALDVHIKKGIPMPAIHGWQTSTNSNLWDIVTHYQSIGINTILCTDIACDGMMLGPNFDLYEQCLQHFPHLAWQASGGIRHVNDLDRLASMGLAAAILGRVLYEGQLDLADCFYDREALC